MLSGAPYMGEAMYYLSSYGHILCVARLHRRDKYWTVATGSRDVIPDLERANDLVVVSAQHVGLKSQTPYKCSVTHVI